MILRRGRVCVKTRGKDAGSYCVVLGKAGKNSVLVEGVGVKEKRASVFHLEPLPLIIELEEKDSKQEIERKLSEAVERFLRGGA